MNKHFLSKYLDINVLLKHLDKMPIEITSVLRFGSSLYEFSNDKSDIDLFVICKTSSPYTEIKKYPYNIHFHTFDTFLHDLNQYETTRLEAVFFENIDSIFFNKCDYFLEYFKMYEKSFRHTIEYKSRKYWKRGIFLLETDSEKGVKCLTYAIKNYILGIAFLEYPKLADKGVVKNLINEEIGSIFNMWNSMLNSEECFPRIKEVYNKYKNKFKKNEYIDLTATV